MQDETAGRWYPEAASLSTRNSFTVRDSEAPEEHRVTHTQKPFERLIHEIVLDMGGNWRFYAKAIPEVQATCEDYLKELNECTNLCAIHAKCVTIIPKGINLAVNFRRDREKPRTSIT